MHMKNNIILIIGLLLLFCTNHSSKLTASNIKTSHEDSISVLSSPDLFDLSSFWAREFNSLNPSAKIRVIYSPVVKTSELNVDAKLGFISQEYYSAIKNQALWKEVIGRDVLVPVINSNNPFLAEIFKQGIAPGKLVQIFTHPEHRNWATLLKEVKNAPLNYYLINDISIKARIVNFLQLDQIPADGTEKTSGKELVAAIQKDPLGFGFCRLTDIVDSGNRQIVENIKLMPIDRNFNGTIDYSEKIYDNLNVFTRGVWIGKYPKALFSNIYAISPTQPSNEIQLAFMKWVLTDGQQIINSKGYSDLALNERQTKVDELISGNIDLVVPASEKSKLKMILLIMAGFVVISFILDKVLNYIKNKNVPASVAAPVFQPVFNEETVSLLNGLYFDKTHTWAFMKKNGLVKIGIDDFLQHVTGPITQIKLKKPGDKIKKGEPVFSIIHDGKQLNINAPVSGVIKEQNQLVNCKSCLINTSPYSDGWIYTIEPSNWIREIQFLFMGDIYKKWLKDEFARLRDFLSVYAKPGSLEYGHVILQDGGEIADNPLSDLGPEVWEEFQTNFIDTSK